MLWNRALTNTEQEQVITYFENKYYTCGPGLFGKYPSCTNCPVNTYKPMGIFYNRTSTGCLACPTGSSTLGATGQSGCTCSAGYYPNGDVCSPCVLGTYKNFDGNSSCVACPSYFGEDLSGSKCHHNLSSKMSFFNAPTSGIDRNLLLHIDASMLGQYSNSSGVLTANSLVNFVANTFTTVTGYGGSLPKASLFHANTPNHPIYLLDFDRTFSQYFAITYPSKLDYFADMRNGTTVIFFGSFNGVPASFERPIDIGSVNGALADNIVIARSDTTTTLIGGQSHDFIETASITQGQKVFWSFTSISSGTKALYANRTLTGTKLGTAHVFGNRPSAVIGKSNYGE